MRTWVLASHRSLTLAALMTLGCSGGNAAQPSSGDGGGLGDASPSEDGGGGSDAPPGDATGGGDGGAPVSVTFSYTPQWSGVSKVDVVGGFGQASDWSKTQSFLTLTKGAAGAWSGTAMLPPGTYLYVFRVTGDAQAAMPATYPRYAIDPLQTAFAPCPMQSPTYSKIDKNPCSQLAVTATGGPAPATAVHVKGTVMLDGAGASNWMVVLEREETMSSANHHYFANRVTTGSDGSFDLVGSMGHYRLQIQAPTLLSQTDLDRDPTTLNTLRRAISASFPIGSSDLTIPSPDVGFHAYGQFAPTSDGGTLPTQFSFENGTAARLDVYGGPGDGGVVEIGDPWFASAVTTDGGAAFGGDFTTMQAMQDAAAPGTRYMWGTEQPYGADASVAWTNQSLVFPIVWH
jgi:hypothetical protein